MIARTWRGAVRADDGDSYVEYLKRTGFAAYASTPGNLGVVGLRRTDGERAEFLLVTLWDSRDAIQHFAGEHPDRAVFYPEDERYLVRRDDHVDHFDVVFLSAAEPAGAGGRGRRGPLAWLADAWAVLAEALAADSRPRALSRGWNVIRLP